jgi:uncharacterized protein (TIGR00369 family)
MPTPQENHDLAGCIACGYDNGCGLGLRFRFEADYAVAETTCDAAWVSWNGIIHGGVLATLMDEAVGWAVAKGGWTGLTARLSVKLLRPVGPGQRLVVRGRVEHWRRGFVEAHAELTTPDGTRVASARSLVFITRDLPQVRIMP